MMQNESAVLCFHNIISHWLYEMHSVTYGDDFLYQSTGS